MYHDDGSTLSVDQAVVNFITGLAPLVGEIVLFGRRRLGSEPAPYPIPTDGVRFVALPDYQSVRHVGAMTRSARETQTIMTRTLPTVDVLLIFGPHPLSISFAMAARRRGIPVVLGVRQDFPRYIAGRVSRRDRVWAVPVAALHEAAFRALSRTTPTLVVGDDLARRYGAERRRHVKQIGISLIHERDLVPRSVAQAASWEGDELRVVSVGRLDPEKNPLLLADVMARLLERDGRWRLDVVGDGPLSDALARRAVNLGLGDRLRLRGYVPNGADLAALYRGAHVFLHVSLTEGLPQVLFEAGAAGLPIVATDVGGVRAALEGGDERLLVPAQDADAAAVALERLRDDPVLRSAAIDHSLAVAARGTMEHAHRELLDLVELAVERTHLDAA